MIEHVLVITTAILRAAANLSADPKTLALRLNSLNTRRMAAIEKSAAMPPAKVGDKTRAELIHYFGRLAEAKVRSRI